MELINVTMENLEKEHICCAISNNKDCQVKSKKKWMTEAFKDGLVFIKGNVRGKCFVEYIPAEHAWAPVDAPEFMYINCLWVSGQYKGNGNSNLLLEACIKDSKDKGKKGLVIISSDKKRPFLADPKYLKYKGFIEADYKEPFYKLFYLPFGEGVSIPKFINNSNQGMVSKEGFSIIYTNQCPYTEKYVPLLINLADSKGVKLKATKLQSKEQAKSAPMPFTSFGLFYNGEYVSNEIPSEKKFEKIIEQMSTK